MSEFKMPKLAQGWLDIYQVGDHLYLWEEVGSWSVYEIVFFKVQIVKATKTRLEVSRIDDERARPSTWEIVRGRGRAEWSPYRNEGEQWRPAGSYRPGPKVYPITPSFTKYFKARQEEFQKEQGANLLAKQISSTPISDLVQLGYDRLLEIKQEIERANRAIIS